MRAIARLVGVALVGLAVALAGEPEAKGLKKVEPQAVPNEEPKKVEPKAPVNVEPKDEPKKGEPKGAEPKGSEPKAEPKKAEPKKAEPKQEAEPEPAVPFLGEVTGERVYIRAGDGINYMVLSVASRGDRVEVSQRRYDWLRIPVPKTCTVWVRQDMVSVEPGGKEATVVKDRVNVRGRPGLTGDVLGQVSTGAKLTVVDADGEWVGVSPPPETFAWIHKQHVRKVGEAGAPPAGKERPALPTMGLTAAAEALRKAQELYQAELAKPADKRNFDDVLAAYQKVATQSDDPYSAAAAERARQRLLKIVDLHNSLRAAREPLDEFDKKYKALEEEYKKRVEEAGKSRPQ